MARRKKSKASGGWIFLVAALLIGAIFFPKKTAEPPAPSPSAAVAAVISAAPSPTPAPTPTPTPEVRFTLTTEHEPVPPGSDAEQMNTYVLNTNTKKFHYPDCESVGDIAPKNYEEFEGYRDVLIDMGFQPCKRCKP